MLSNSKMVQIEIMMSRFIYKTIFWSKNIFWTSWMVSRFRSDLPPSPCRRTSFTPSRSFDHHFVTHQSPSPVIDGHKGWCHATCRGDGRRRCVAVASSPVEPRQTKPNRQTSRPVRTEPGSHTRPVGSVCEPRFGSFEPRCSLGLQTALVAL